MNRITRTRTPWNARTWRVCLIMTMSLSVVALPGCGGGGSSTKSVSKTPTKATKDHVKSLYTQSFSSLAQSGVSNSALSAMRGSLAFASGGGAATSTGVVSTPTAAPSDNSSHAAGPPVPQIGQFLQNIASARKSVRARAINTMQARHAGTVRLTRDDSAGSTPPDPGTGVTLPAPTFYYDDYLGLWVDINDTPTLSTYTLYEDEAKTKPAGSIVTQTPASFDTFPQVYSSDYNFTAGYQTGAHGSYKSTYNADNSGSSAYQDVYADGSQDQGSSANTSQGAYTWTGRTDYPDKTYSSFRGSFLPNGSGGTHFEGSDGYISDYTYNADGTGQARITGPDPGLPVTIDWDAQGNTTIHYADGSTDFITGWGFGGGVVAPVATSGGTAAGATVSTSSDSTSKAARKATR